MSNEQIKVTDKRKILEIIEWLKILLQSTFPKQYMELIEKFILSLALRYFQTPYLEKRISGLQDIKSYILRLSNSDNNKQGETWITREYVLIIKKNHFIFPKQIY